MLLVAFATAGMQNAGALAHHQWVQLQSWWHCSNPEQATSLL